MSAGRIVRAPNHLGDVVLALPALTAAQAHAVVTRPGLAPLLAMGGVTARPVPLEAGTRALLETALELRSQRYHEGILLTPSFSSALLFRLGGVSHVRGTDTDARRALLNDAVPLDRIRGLHRSDAFQLLVTGKVPDRPSPPLIRVPDAERARWRDLHDVQGSVVVGVFPGSNASSRRWAAERFASVVRALAAEHRVVVFGGPDERELTRAVAATSAFDAGGRTDVPLLAAGLEACHILLSNDSGPLHLAAAVGTPTVSLWGAGNPAVTGVLGRGHTMLRRDDLPCVPCVKNECPRTGPGTLLSNAERECLELIEVEDVLNALLRALAA